MANAVQCAINGANGRMGRALQNLLREDARFELVAAIGALNEWRDVSKLDVVIDFSSPAERKTAQAV